VVRNSELFPQCTVVLDPPKDGNCLFSTIADQLRLHLGSDVSASSVRSDIVEYLWNRRSNMFLLDGTEISLSAYVQQSDIDTYLKNMSKCGSYGDHVVLLGACCLYSVQFIALSSLGATATRSVAPNKESTIQPDLPILLIGHQAEEQGKHYVSVHSDSTSSIISAFEKQEHFKGIKNVHSARSFHREWASSWSWLVYDEQSDPVTSSLCSKANASGLLSLEKRRDDAFNSSLVDSTTGQKVHTSFEYTKRVHVTVKLGRN